MIAESTCVFCVAVAVKKPLRRHRSFLILRDTGPEANRAVAALHSGASRADIMAPIAQSGGDGLRGGAGRKLDLPFGDHTWNCRRPADWHVAHQLARSAGWIPFSRLP
ncbi:MAG: hypothetical protein WCI23_09815 [Chlorobiaceae bacterium]